MMKVFRLKQDDKLTTADLKEAAAILKRGGIIVVPTDTSYGLAALINKPASVQRVFSLKGRSSKKTVSMAVRSKAQAGRYARFSAAHEKLWKDFMPGPLTLVMDARIRKLHPLLVKNGTLAVRLVPTPAVNQLLRSIGVPITITSANKSGRGDIYSYREFMKHYKHSPLPNAFIDAGQLKRAKPSTVVRISDNGKVDILRQGPVSKAAILRAVKNDK